MFEKLPAARMNKTESSAPERLIAGAPKRRGKQTLHDTSRHFPSYLPLFGNFFAPLIAESHWGAARLLADCCGRFPTVQTHVAFL
ncbi:MAG TPA: hypothetical protein VIS53_00150 [Candidatus Udaeobacter sp.]|jgi:hypothetical protein